MVVSHHLLGYMPVSMEIIFAVRAEQVLIKQMPPVLVELIVEKVLEHFLGTMLPYRMLRDGILSRLRCSSGSCDKPLGTVSMRILHA